MAKQVSIQFDSSQHTGEACMQVLRFTNTTSDVLDIDTLGNDERHKSRNFN